ncbi:MAG: CPBP family intramembrane metalloprotease domain-containing protein [Chloroflexi bacterium HGW-Chloroflexi-10]|nr:MAG: CPBP family intramembrane metalloprotease domain-containing protein [Chloroflexi bacterium HGW-Chloroflexi-10]
MISNATPQKKIITFLVLLLVLSSIFYVWIISAGGIQAYGGLLVLGIMWVPGVSGIITKLIYERSLRGMGWKPGKAKYLLLAYVIPLIYCLVVYGITWLTGLGKVPNPELMDQIMLAYGGANTSPLVALIIYCVLIATIGMVSGLLSGAGEEIGWRGFFVPELAKITTFPRVALISGAVWTVWHLPIILFANYNMPGIPKWYAAVMFTIMVTGINVLFSWLRLKSGSLWPAVILHASHNLFVQAIFTPLTLQTKITPYIIDEFGIGLALVGIVIGWFFLLKGKQLHTKDISNSSSDLFVSEI